MFCFAAPFAFIAVINAVAPQKSEQVLRHGAEGSTIQTDPRLFVTGGYGGSWKDVDAFDLQSESAVKVSSLPTPRYALGAVTLHGLVYAIGGRHGDEYLATVDVYISPIDTWMSSPPMSTARCCLAVCTFDNKIYAIGGWNGTNSVDTVEVYDPTVQWKSIKPMPSRRHQHAIGVLRGEIYAVGGYEDRVTLNSVVKYDPKSDRWSTVHSMALRSNSLSAAVVDERLFAIGGADGSENVLDQVEVYDPDADRWDPGESMPMRRRFAGAVSHGGLIYIAAGYNGSDYLDSVAIYDPEARVWSQTRMKLSAKRGGSGVTIL